MKSGESDQVEGQAETIKPEVNMKLQLQHILLWQEVIKCWTHSKNIYIKLKIEDVFELHIKRPCIWIKSLSGSRLINLM